MTATYYWCTVILMLLILLLAIVVMFVAGLLAGLNDAADVQPTAGGDGIDTGGEGCGFGEPVGVGHGGING